MSPRFSNENLPPDDDIVRAYASDDQMSVRELERYFAARNVQVSYEHLRTVLSRNRVPLHAPRSAGTKKLNVNFRPPTRAWYERFERFVTRDGRSRRAILIEAVTEYMTRHEGKQSDE